MLHFDTAPYRNTQLTPLCEICREPATLRCPRCGRLFCAEHSEVEPGRRCIDCESGYEVTKTKVRTASMVIAIVSWIAALFAGAIIGLEATWAIIASLFGSALLASSHPETG